MSRRRYVQYLTEASIVVEVEVDDDVPEDEVEEIARELAYEAFRQQADPTLCYHCARKIGLGDFEQDDSKDGVWA